MQPECHIDAARFHVLIADRPCLECQVQRLTVEKAQPVTTGEKAVKACSASLSTAPPLSASAIAGCAPLHLANKRAFECRLPQRNFEIIDPLHSVAKIDLS